uniref:Uncharacterized protein n=1 Tax=Anguilla anguilla TaxID=7936 RepID=A0A0E9TYD8_ANGAN
MEIKGIKQIVFCE